MIAVAFITVISQHWISKKSVRADLEKLNKQMKSDFENFNSQFKYDVDKIGLQVKSDFQMKMKFDWILNVRKVIADLITTTDPEYNTTIDRRKMLYLINQAQLILDVNNKDEDKLARLITELGHVADYADTRGEGSVDEILKVQAEIISQTRIVLKEKQEANM